MDIPGNEIADRHAKDAASKIGPYEKPEIRYLSAVKKQINDFFTNRWKKRWSNRAKSKETASGTLKLTPEVTPATRRLHAGLTKEFSALLIQLKTGIISFNDFLFRRRVPTILSPRCACDTAAITIYYILLDYPI